MHRKATVRACRSVNPGIIILGITRTVSRSHWEFCMTLCTWQHEGGALYIMILTDSEDAFSGEQFFGTQNGAPKRWECLAWTGFTTNGDRARLDSNLPAMSCARVWTNSFTVAEHIQQEVIAKEGPSQSEELFPFAEKL